MEEFKQINIDGFSNYEINKLGVVRNSNTNRVLKHQHRNGYKSVALYHDGEYMKNFYVHYLVYHCFKIDDIESFKVPKNRDYKEREAALKFHDDQVKLHDDQVKLHALKPCQMSDLHVCSCGAPYSLNSRDLHMKSKRHLEHLEHQGLQKQVDEREKLHEERQS
jgi:hypothetical protein